MVYLDRIRKTLCMMFLAFFTQYSLAQNEVGKLSIEPQIGFDVSNLTKAGLNSKIGFCGGVNVEYKVTKPLSMSIGTIYSVEGAKDGQAKLSPAYINIPLRANLYVTDNLSLNAGIQLGVNVADNREDFLLFGDAKSTTFSIPIGISYNINKFIVNVSYNVGLTNVYDNYNYKNSFLQLTLGYKIHI